MKHLTHSLTVVGVVPEVDERNNKFSLGCRSGDMYDVFVGETTMFRVFPHSSLSGKSDSSSSGMTAGANFAAEVGRCRCGLNSKLAI